MAGSCWCGEVGLALLADAERRFDGPIPDGVATSAVEDLLRQSAEAAAARRFFRGRVARALRFVRSHRQQSRPDLEQLVLADARSYRAAFRDWHRRCIALEAPNGSPAGAAYPGGESALTFDG